MGTAPTLSELLARAKVVDDPPRVIREIQLRLDRALDRHRKEIHSSARKPRFSKSKA